MGVGAMGFITPANGKETGVFPAHTPLGDGKGINPGRVVWTHNPDVVHWDGIDYWWRPENFKSAPLLDMFQTGIMDLVNQDSPAKAWQALFEWRNKQNGSHGGYKAGQKIAIKTNMNGAGEYNDDKYGMHAIPYGNPALLHTVLISLVSEAGVKPEDITVFDTCRIFPEHMRELCSSGKLEGVKFRFRDPMGKYDASVDKNAQIHWSGPIDGSPTYFPLCLTEANYLINLANLKGHSWGLTLTAKNHFGSFINEDRRTTPATAGLHPNIIHAKMGDYSALTDLIATPQINNKTILWILDALITAPSETVNISPGISKWQMPPFNGYYPASLFLSQDPVAIDSVGADFLVNEPVMLEHNRGLGHNHGMENYLHEAALIASPPSGAKYGENAVSLGAHEHWNNATDKQYSGNIQPGKGIELVYKRL